MHSCQHSHEQPPSMPHLYSITRWLPWYTSISPRCPPIRPRWRPFLTQMLSYFTQILPLFCPISSYFTQMPYYFARCPLFCPDTPFFGPRSLHSLYPALQQQLLWSWFLAWCLAGLRRYTSIFKLGNCCCLQLTWLLGASELHIFHNHILQCNGTWQPSCSLASVLLLPCYPSSFTY